MKFKNDEIVIAGFAVFMLVSLFITFADAEKWEISEIDIKDSGVIIPEHEFVGYTDSNGVYTVIGVIKNYESFPVTPTIIVNIEDGQQTISKTLEYVPILPSKELPFKIKFPEVKSLNPILNAPAVSYVASEENPINVEVIYDETLIQHDDGHLTGRLINNGSDTVYNIKVFAMIHGFEHETLDMGQNVRIIEKLEPGEISNFSMYPDPSIKDDEVFYYSCFAVTDSFVRPQYTERNEKKFYFRYDSGTWYVDPEFNEEGTELTMRTQNSFPLATYANFEFPKFADDEEFEVFVNGDTKESIQSIDENGNWHVAFTVEPRESGWILITGFKEGWDPGDRILIPDWIKSNASWWSEDQIDDEVFRRGIEFLIKEEIIKIDEQNKNQNEMPVIPEWVKINASWWSEDQIPDETFIKSLEFLIREGVIQM